MDREEILAQSPCFLTQDQRETFYDQGYLAFPGLLGDEQLDPLRAALAGIVDLSRELSSSNNRFDLERGHSAESPRLRRATYLDDLDPAFWDLCSASVVPDIAADILGPNVRFREIMANFKWAGGGAEVKWHQDIVFYPHTHVGTCQFLVMLEAVGPEQGPLQVVAGSHKGPIFEHYDDNGEWTGAIADADLAALPLNEAVALTGPAGTVSVHHSCTVHGSASNMSASSRPAFVITYSAADAIAYTAPPYPSSHYGALVRGHQPRHAHHEALRMPLPPDWSGGYTSIFEHQDQIDANQ
ncbi:MAG: phytanoyl-CoA dioxygenase family protein [Hyphomicrobiales bacterium]